MFGIEFPEFVVIAVVALIVLGPERLPKIARFAGLWVRRARAQWHSVKDELERDLAADELKRNLEDTRALMRQADQDLRASGEQLRRDLDDIAAQATTTTTPASTEPPPPPHKDDDAVR